MNTINDVKLLNLHVTPSIVLGHYWTSSSFTSSRVQRTLHSIYLIKMPNCWTPIETESEREMGEQNRLKNYLTTNVLCVCTFEIQCRINLPCKSYDDDDEDDETNRTVGESLSRGIDIFRFSHCEIHSIIIIIIVRVCICNLVVCFLFSSFLFSFLQLAVGIRKFW